MNLLPWPLGLRIWVAFVVALLLRVKPSVPAPAFPVQLRAALAEC